MCLGNNQDNFQLHRFTTSENIAKNFRGGATFLTHTVYGIYRITVDFLGLRGAWLNSSLVKRFLFQDLTSKCTKKYILAEYCLSCAFITKAQLKQYFVKMYLLVYFLLDSS